MNKVLALRIVNTVLVFSFILQAITVAIIFLKIRTSYNHIVFEIHEYNGLLIIAVVIAHVTLNWGWIKANLLRKRQ